MYWHCCLHPIFISNTPVCHPIRIKIASACYPMQENFVFLRRILNLLDNIRKKRPFEIFLVQLNIILSKMLGFWFRISEVMSKSCVNSQNRFGHLWPSENDSFGRKSSDPLQYVPQKGVEINSEETFLYLCLSNYIFSMNALSKVT